MRQCAGSTGGLDPLPFPALPSTELVHSVFPHALLLLQACGANSVGPEEMWEDMR